MNLLPAACLAAAYAWGTYHRNSPLFGGVIGRLPSPRDGRIALTFDDGPNPDATPRVLDVLRSYGVPATFFQLGRHVDAWPECAAAVGADGHDIGNHGWAHQKLTWAGPRRAARDVLDGTQSLERAHGRGALWFRAPHGFRSPFVDDAVHRAGQRLVGWSLGVFDSARPGAREIARRVIAGARPGGIILLHDGDGYDPAGDRRQTAESLPEIIETLLGRGLQFTTLTAALSTPAP